MSLIIFAGEGLRMLKRKLRVDREGFWKYEGNAKQICEQIINDCWNGTFFQTSAGHFCQFYARDFGFCTEPLIKLGYRKKVLKTLEYAMNIYKKYDKITTTINPKGIPFNVFTYAPDSLAFFMRSLKLAKADKLIEKNKAFLNRKIDEFYKKVIDPTTGLVRKDKFFSSMKDNSKRVSSCYDNCMVAMLKENLGDLNNPFKKYDYKKLIKENFWKKTHFVDDLSGKDFIAGDANLFPYWTGLFTSKEMFKKSSEIISKAGLDKPFPLRYYHKKDPEQKMLLVELFAKDYERDTVWIHMGMLYLQTVKKFNKPLFKKYLNQYTKLIEKHKNFLEIFEPNQKPYKSPFYCCDESMLWSSVYLTESK